MKILFTCVGRRVELIQCFANAAKKGNYELEIHGADCSDTAPALFFCNKRHLVPRIDADNYLAVLLAICKEEAIDLLIPTIDTDLVLLSTNRAAFDEVGTRLLLCDAGLIRQCRNKLLSVDLFRNAGLNAPESTGDVTSYRAGFPAFIKPVDGSSSIDAYRADNREKLRLLAEEIPHYIIQPYISGDEYTIDIFCDFSGNPVYITPRKRLAMRSGEVIKTEIDMDETIIGEAEKLVAAIRPCGAMTIQLIREKATQTDWFIEINPRFGGGAPLTIDAGADSALAILQLLDGQKLSYQKNAAEDGVLYLRFDQSIKIHRKEDEVIGC